MDTMFVSKFYQMDPDTEDVLGEGTMLENGMIVLIEDSTIRGNEDREDKYELERLLEVNRWATVTQFKVTPRFDRNQYDEIIGEGSPLISFVAVYGDRSKKKRRYDASFAWLVKLDTDGKPFINTDLI